MNIFQLTLRRFVALSLAVAFGISARAESQPPMRVACVGDIITAGYALEHPEHDAYPAQLAELLGDHWEVRSFGVSGACLIECGGYPFSYQKSAEEAIDWKPDMVIFAIGTNDTKNENIRDYVTNFAPSFRKIVERFRTANPGVRIYVCLPPLFSATMCLRTTELREVILPLLRDLAPELNLQVIALDSRLRDSVALCPGKVHPSVVGAGIIARTVYGEIMLCARGLSKSLDPSKNTALVPVPALETDSYNWWTRHADELALHATANPEVVMIGDSITHFWFGVPKDPRSNGPKAWERLYAGIPVVNLGFGWDRTQNVLWRLDHGEFDGYQPRLVIVNIGTNNLTPSANARGNSPQEIANGVVAICERVHAKAPSAHVLVMGIFPRGQKATDWLRTPIRETNKCLDEALAHRAGVTFLDIGARFLNEHGDMDPVLMPDGTHPSEIGYEIWATALRESGLLPESRKL